MIVVNKVSTGGSIEQLAIQSGNVITANPNPENTSTSWLAYWDGSQVRKTIVDHSVTDIAKFVNDTK